MLNVILILFMTVVTASAAALDGMKLFRLEGGKKVSYELKPETKYVALYQSASWCPPCRKVTPILVKEYQTMLKADQIPVEIVLMSGDRSESAMVDYMRKYKMKWPAMEWNNRAIANQYIADGIPHLVVIDLATGKAVTKGTGQSDIKKVVSKIRKFGGTAGGIPIDKNIWNFRDNYTLVAGIVVSFLVV